MALCRCRHCLPTMKEIPQDRAGFISELRIEHPEAVASTARSPPMAGVALARWRRLLYRRDFALSPASHACVLLMLAPRELVKFVGFLSSLRYFLTALCHFLNKLLNDTLRGSRRRRCGSLELIDSSEHLIRMKSSRQRIAP